MSGLFGKTNIAAAGGGGSDLNFSVVGGTVQPSGQENRIWVNTSTPVTNWVVSPNQPGNPAAGMVWIKDGTSNGINIVKRNAVEVFPSDCKQYVDGAWTHVDAYLFLNGAWVQFAFTILYIMQNGRLATGYSFNIPYSDKSDVYTAGNGITGNGPVSHYSVWNIKPALTEISAKTLNVRISNTFTYDNQEAAIGITKSVISSSMADTYDITTGIPSVFQSYKRVSRVSGYQTVSIPISSYSGKYVGLLSGDPYSLTDIWLE